MKLRSYGTRWDSLDNQAFATTQAMNHFVKQFSHLDEATGKHVLDSEWLALFDSLSYVGLASSEVSLTPLPRISNVITVTGQACDGGRGPCNG